LNNGAFEAPRSAPAPRPPQTLDKVSILAPLVQREAQATLKHSAADDETTPELRLNINITLTDFAALSIRPPKKQAGSKFLIVSIYTS
jgi:hypothetical protein